MKIYMVDHNTLLSHFNMCAGVREQPWTFIFDLRHLPVWSSIAIKYYSDFRWSLHQFSLLKDIIFLDKEWCRFVCFFILNIYFIQWLWWSWFLVILISILSSIPPPVCVCVHSCTCALLNCFCYSLSRYHSSFMTKCKQRWCRYKNRIYSDLPSKLYL